MSAKEQVANIQAARRRDQEEHQRHLQAIQQDLERARLLQEASLKEIDAWLGGPYIRELLVAVWYTKQAGEALTSPPMENTARVSNPSSSRDEGAPTRRARKLKRSVKYHLERVTETISKNLEYDPKLSEQRRFAALESHHSRGLHEENPVDDCARCA